MCIIRGFIGGYTCIYICMFVDTIDQITKSTFFSKNDSTQLKRYSYSSCDNIEHLIVNYNS